MPSMEEDLRRGIASAMADSLDGQVIGGSGTAPNLSGLFHQADDVAVDGTTETFGTATGTRHRRAFAPVPRLCDPCAKRVCP